MVDETHLVAAPMVQTDDAVAWIRSLAIHKVVCGEEWQGSERWQKLEAALAPFQIEVIYAPKTEGISTTLLKQRVLQNP